MRVAVVASHLFEPTHHGLARLAAALARLVHITLFAKHPLPYSEDDVPRPLPLEVFLRNPTCVDLVHCVGGGKTAMHIARVIRPGTPLIVSFVGAVDLTRQLNDHKLADGYQALFERASCVTCPDEEDAQRLLDRGASRNALLVLPPALPLREYPLRASDAARRVIVAARSLPRKNHARAIAVAQRVTSLDELLIVGETGAWQRVTGRGVIPHGDYVAQMQHCRVLLQSADWQGGEVDRLPISVLEALVMGLSVVSTPVRGVVELSMLFPSRVRIGSTHDELARLVELALRNRKDDGDMRRWIYARYGFDRAVTRILEMYDQAGLKS
jgi:glycosyltransferase involved in cell wall biosynthesis